MGGSSLMCACLCGRKGDTQGFVLKRKQWQMMLIPRGKNAVPGTGQVSSQGGLGSSQSISQSEQEEARREGGGLASGDQNHVSPARLPSAEGSRQTWLPPPALVSCAQ